MLLRLVQARDVKQLNFLSFGMKLYAVSGKKILSVTGKAMNLVLFVFFVFLFFCLFGAYLACY